MASTTDANVFVTVSALDGGHLTLPERLFVTDADPDIRRTVPSLSFLIQHPSPSSDTKTTTKLVFDLGLKRDIAAYTPSQRAHIAQRQPVIVDPDLSSSLRKGNLDPSTDIDIVIVSHVHWDHVGTSSDFGSATFFVGSGTLDVLKNGAGPLYPAYLFNDDELPLSRTVEFPPVPGGQHDYSGTSYTPNKYTETPADSQAKLPDSAKGWAWQSLASFPHVLDFFGDGSLYVIDSPGHLYGHVNLLARIGDRKYVYLGGDCCHDPRILRGEKGIALYEDGRGGLRSVHVDTSVARNTLDQIAGFVSDKKLGVEEVEVEVEVVVAHDAVWREGNGHRFWPGSL
ncbi:hypothetical protein B0H63DRAFT_391396 [Podospora didyma]|uniref:Metallo-beta-lactamase domain-containing protein n=1 Tax=Podospora didyma TaxID=330526 RepID=A0AAE0NUQ3_9PEZI|nr:hypothetical protein B0H63DRAFT_391396 [Podospora didyma]